MQIIVYGNSNLKDFCSPFHIFGGDEGKRRLALIKLLHKQKSIESFLEGQELDVNSIEKDLHLLEEALLIEKSESNYQPKFFIATKEELSFAKCLAYELAIGLVNPLKDWYTELRNLATRLSIADRFTWEEVNFLLVGSFILELGFKYIANSGKNKFFTCPPHRKSGLYFLLALEIDTPDILGHYQNYFLELGDYSVAAYGRWSKEGVPHSLYPLMKKWGAEKARRNICHLLACYESFYRGFCDIPQETLSILKSQCLIDEKDKVTVPICSSKDCRLISNLAKLIGANIGSSFDNYSQVLENTFRGFPASSYSCFSEFYCWFYRLIANCALDILIYQGFIDLPKGECAPFILKVPLEYPV